MPRIPGIGLLIVSAMLMVLLPPFALAQDDPNDMPLGDLARNLRKKSVPAKPVVSKPVIDDDNLPQVMERGENRQGFGSGLRYLMAGESKGFEVAAPDVTCSLAFTANVKSLLSGQYAQADLPAEEMGKLQGKATIEGDSLIIPVFNGTNWHVSELAVALTVVRKNAPNGFLGAIYSAPGAGVEIDPGASAEADPLEQVRSEKKSDLTVIYKMRTAAPPWERAVFSAPLNLELAPGEEWHWAIVQAKGYPPESYAAPQPRVTETRQETAPVPVSLTDPGNPLAVTPQHP
ncbi:MAG: hypothetical protein WA485_26855 [Candidatus Sulfotelmatobacter sp.]